ncbi:MAG: hypothetical protein JM57_09425 [Comamonadaceae bacterium BICA1-1]|nr:MAG: hypothetical protein JM57_09425 [Comamonadaceae bacterium BICA1-1]
MGPEDGAKWAAAVDLQPTLPKSDRLPDTTALLRACVQDLCARQPAPDLLLLSGDLSDSGSAADYALLRQLVQPLRALGVPILPLVGNHDRRAALRHACADWLQACQRLHPTFVQYVWHCPKLRLVALDTVAEGSAHGELCAERLRWLEQALAASPLPTLLLLHHPPYATGLAEMDCMALRQGAAELEALLWQHPQVQALLCGHLHRLTVTQVAHALAISAPSTAHQIALDLRADQPARYRLEPPGYLLHRWHGGRLLTHTVVVGDFGAAQDFDSL